MSMYRIKNWSTKFEKAQSRKCESLNWVAVSNRFDSPEFRRIIRLEDGPQVYACWIMLLQIASRGSNIKDRGLLASESGQPLTADDFELVTGVPQKLFARAIEVLVSQGIELIEIVPDSQPTGSQLPANSQPTGRPLPTQTDIQTKTEQTTTKTGQNKQSSPKGESERLYEAYPRKEGRAVALKAIAKALKKETFEKLMEAVTEYAKAKAKAGADPQYIPHPATWFNEERYHDDRSNWKSTNGNIQRSGQASGSHGNRPGRHFDPTQGDAIAEVIRAGEAAAASPV